MARPELLGIPFAVTGAVTVLIEIIRLLAMA
jgi:hypothetical protein